MTAAKAVNAQGTVIKVGNGASPEVFYSISEVKDIGEIGGTSAVIDATTLDSPAKEKKIGLVDFGQLTLQLHYDSTDTNGQAVLVDAQADRQPRNFKIVIPADGDIAEKTLSFSAFVISYKAGSFGVDQIVPASCTLEITGLVTGL